MSDPSGRSVLTDKTYKEGMADLIGRDRDLAAVVEKWGRPPFWTHVSGLPGLVLAILAQQVSLESAQSAFTKLESAIGAVQAQALLSLDDDRLREIGFSRQKASYVRGIAQAISNGKLDLAQIEGWDDESARSRLMDIRGVGRWTADTYLLFSLRRADVWPTGDLALVKSVQEVKELLEVPGFEEVDNLALMWKPWRAVAARILWHSYLCERGRQ